MDIEEMSDGISIIVLRLNEFRLDLPGCMKLSGDMDIWPRGLHAVVPAAEGLPEEAVFLKDVADCCGFNVLTASKTFQAAALSSRRLPRGRKPRLSRLMPGTSP